MPIIHDAVLYSVVREEHLVHSGFFLHEYFSLFASARWTACTSGRSAAGRSWAGWALAAHHDFRRALPPGGHGKFGAGRLLTSIFSARVLDSTGHMWYI